MSSTAEHNFTVVRLGAESESAIARMRSQNVSTPFAITIACKQVPQDIQPDDYALIWLGTNNNKGGATPWVQGLRALGRIDDIQGEPGYNNPKNVRISVDVLLSESLTKRNFIAETGASYLRISELPVVGINNYSSQVIQRIDVNDESQDVQVLMQAIERLNPGFARATIEAHPDLARFFISEGPVNRGHHLDVSDLPPGLVVNEDGVESNPEIGDEAITEPWDPTKTKFDTRPFTLDLLMRRVEYGEIDLKPDFQRRAGLWSIEQKSRLIESLLVRIPLPAFYFDATAESRWLVVDGLQRMTVFREFIFGDLRLEKLEFLSAYEGLRFRDLPRDLQRRIEETQVVVHLIQPGTPPQVKFNIFRRINTGGLVLTGQEIRHALFQGRATRLLHELVQNKAFLSATAWSIKSDRMADREFVLRFLSFSITPPSEYRSPDMDSFLNQHMATINNMSEESIKRLSDRFTRAMCSARDIFGDHAFRKTYAVGQARMPINKALFETWSVSLGRLDQHAQDILVQRRDVVVARAIRALHDRHYETAVSVGTQDVKKVRLRFSTVEQILADVLDTAQPEFRL